MMRAAVLAAVGGGAACALAGGAGCGWEDECASDAESARQYVEAARLQNLSCAAPADCTTVSVSTSCQGDCPAVVSVAGKAAVEAAVAEANERWCDDRAGCGYATPSCIMPEPVCEKGACADAAP
ncbi:MAG: hypothetical protein HY744_00610 [Deltaproteobacteria bacterium]|nr:hypothetical protein [Deltaproteobacteria bacterium]